MKTISRQSVYDTLRKDCPEAMELYLKFESNFRTSRAFDEKIPVCDVEHFLNCHPKALAWAIKEGFIEKDEETFAVGDTVMIDSCGYYKFHVVGGNKVQLLNEDGQTCLGQVLAPKDRLRIKRSELPIASEYDIEKLKGHWEYHPDKEEPCTEKSKR